MASEKESFSHLRFGSALLSEGSTTIDGRASDSSFCADSSAPDKEVSELPRCQTFVLGSMQVDCVSVCSPSQKPDTSSVEPPQTLIFIDWDDAFFPTAEIFDHWRVPTSKAQWEGFNFSSAQTSLLAAWRDAAYQYLLTSCNLYASCVIVTSSPRQWIQDVIDAFAPNLRTLFDGPNGPRVVYACEVSEEGVEDEQKSKSSTAAGHSTPVTATGPNRDDELSRSWKLAVMRREAKAFYWKLVWQGQLCESAGDTAYELDAIDGLSFRRAGPPVNQHRTKRAMSLLVPTISQTTMRMLRDSQHQHWAVWYDVDEPLDLSPSKDVSEAFPEVTVVSPPRSRSYAGTTRKPQNMELSHRQELRSYQDEFIEIARERLCAHS